MPVEINGTTGIASPGLASENMPTVAGDAVVESGSNSDGQWTRWADGTQHVSSTHIVVHTASAGRQNKTWALPAPFIDGEYRLVGAATGGGSGATGDVVFTINAVSNTAVEAHYFIRSVIATSGGNDNFPVDVMATGRWK